MKIFFLLNAFESINGNYINKTNFKSFDCLSVSPRSVPAKIWNVWTYFDGIFNGK